MLGSLRYPASTLPKRPDWNVKVLPVYVVKAVSPVQVFQDSFTRLKVFVVCVKSLRVSGKNESQFLLTNKMNGLISGFGAG